ncbi:unnamed protein product [marine sediment metagenome]|uniref:Bacterial Ig-like domain-containing protein n=1 Tax=marine sediment metagenome TaxID=412755 RepID=X1BED8_9ZZZZ
MVQYLASYATKSITVTTSEVGTTLTIIAPASTIQGQPFIIEGVLKRGDTGVPLEGENIGLSFNGANLGTTLTRSIEGSIKYQATVQIDDVGEYTLRADFAGSTRPGLTLGPSNAFREIGVDLLSAPVIEILASTILGIALVMLGFTK